VLKKLQGEENQNIVQIYEIVIRELDIFIVMEKCSGGDLNDLRKRRLDQKQSFTELEVISVIRAIANAYTACMRFGIIHRDIKPANILVHNNTYLLTDFGMGRIINDVGKKLKMSIVGSPIFASPQILQENPYSIKCDVYSVHFYVNGVAWSSSLFAPLQHFPCLRRGNK
jgi:serine/threonine protein kinase